MKDQSNGIGDYSSSPTGQGCLWVAALGIVGILAFSYLGTYAGFPDDPLDRVESGIAGVTRPAAVKQAKTLHAHRRSKKRRVVYHTEE